MISLETKKLAVFSMALSDYLWLLNVRFTIKWHLSGGMFTGKLLGSMSEDIHFLVKNIFSI